MLTVYLDTSDFSYFAKVRQGKGKPEHEVILESLLNFKNTGLVEFRYSFVHMAEFLNTNKDDLKGNLEKGKILEELCEGKVFEFITSIWEAEIVAGINLDKSFLADKVYSDDGCWFPEKEGKDKLEKIITEGKEILKNETSLNRKERRTKLAELRKLDEREMYADGLKRGLVKDRIMKKVLERYINKDIEKKEIIPDLMNKATKPSVLLDENQYSALLRDTFSKIVTHLGINFSELLEELKNSLPAINTQKEKRFFKNQAQEFKFRLTKEFLIKIHTVINKNKFKKNKDGVTQLDLENLSKNPNFEFMPSIFAFNLFISSYINKHGLNRETKNKISDGGDALHCLYAPYSNIFRADRATCNLISGFEKHFNILVVDTLESLPTIIEHALNRAKEFES